MNNRKIIIGHILACLTEVIWGATFVSSKILLQYFSPVVVLTMRVLLAFIIMCLIYPKPFRPERRKQEGIFALAGLTGLVMYFLLENKALTMTYAANVGIIVTCAPFFVAIVVGFIFKSEKPGWNFFVGFVISLSGVALVSLIGNSEAGSNPAGDMLALLAMVSWGFYSALTKKISEWNYPVIAVTRRIYLYGLIMLIPLCIFTGGKVDPNNFSKPEIILNILFLGICASALGFIMWNYSTKLIGAIKTSIYIYVSPVMTLILSVLILQEKLTLLSFMGIILIFVGLLLSQGVFIRKKEK